MSNAAYDRGSMCIRNQAAQDARPAIFAMMDDYNAMPKHEPAAAPFLPVAITPGHGGFWLYDPRTSYGFWYRTLAEAVRSWRIDLTGYDASTQTWTAIPVPKEN